MIFEWDDKKSRRTYAERGFDFTHAARVFADPCRLERIDRRRDYGEERHQTIGEVDGRTFFVVFTRAAAKRCGLFRRRAYDHDDQAYRESKAWR